MAISWLVYNACPGIAEGGWFDGVYLSASGVLDANAILLGRFPSGGGLNWDSNELNSATITMPLVATGAYSLIVRTNDTGALAETNTADNTLSTPVTLLAAQQLTAAPSVIPVSVNPGGTATGTITLTNFGGGPLSGVTATVSGASANVTVQISAPSEMQGLSTQQAAFTVAASDDSVRQCSPTVTFTTTEGAQAAVTFNVVVNAAQAEISASPSTLVSNMLVGSQTLVEFQLTNTGADRPRILR